MGWFNVLKGAYPSLQQIDRTLPVASGVTGIVRGSLIYEDAGSWKLGEASVEDDPTAYMHFALQAQTDLTAGMAGSIGQGVPGGTARVTGLSVGMPIEFETDQYVAGSYSVGDMLTVADGGKLTLFSTGTKNCIAQVTKAPASRWVNDAIAVTGYRLGAWVSVITGRTLWIPVYVHP